MFGWYESGMKESVKEMSGQQLDIRTWHVVFHGKSRVALSRRVFNTGKSRVFLKGQEGWL